MVSGGGHSCMNMAKQASKGAQRENPFNSLVLNILLPVVVLTQADRFIDSPAQVLLLALAFPVGYFVYDFARRKKANFVSILGFVSVLLTGGVGLLELPRFWFVVKEASIPALIGLVVAGSLLTRKPLIEVFLYSPQVFDVERINTVLAERGTTGQMHRLLRLATALLAATFGVSAVLNFVLANHFVKTEPSVDAAQFNAEVGAMTGWSYVVIALPSTVMLVGLIWWLSKGIQRLTGLKFEEALAAELRDEKASEKNS